MSAPQRSNESSNGISTEIPLPKPEAWLEGPVRDLLRVQYASLQSVEGSNARLFASYHWTVWQKALEKDSHGTALFHKILFMKSETAGVSREDIRTFHEDVLYELIDITLNRNKNSQFAKKINIKQITLAYCCVMNNFYELK